MRDSQADEHQAHEKQADEHQAHEKQADESAVDTETDSSEDYTDAGSETESVELAPGVWWLPKPDDGESLISALGGRA
ncbi:hypothetical protein Ga0074812_101109 [Parafrankia irregularis]|uniref:Uncharacterized protein n=1 Tax=Parafrankia irregularis TaxID=795642 RepID=A0A0S4QDJ3_9ACTN|nr:MULTISPECIES: hypothetical protein [Parafrankia]MBE3199717.1 hypothetical protein [Parafrankia sp. CH37]CUU53611.1 hypothetical protein Ga0074812_101109 [Parafrankia irregularis]